MLFLIVCYTCSYEVVRASEAEQSPVQRMDEYAQRAIWYLNRQSGDHEEVISHHEKALGYFTKILDVFADFDCERVDHCETDLVGAALEAYGQAAEVHLELVERFGDYRTRGEQKDSLKDAEIFLTRAVTLADTYGVKEDGMEYFNDLMARHDQLNEKHDGSEEL